MNRYFRFFAFAFIVMAISCTYNNDDELYDYSPAVDLNDVLQAYQWFLKAPETGDKDEELKARILNVPDDTPWLFTDTSFVVQLPEYAHSKHPFLPFAEEFYNCMVYGWDMWSNLEVWFRGVMTGSVEDGDDEVSLSIKDINTGFIHDSEIRNAAEEYKAALLKSIAKVPHSEEEQEATNMPYDALNEWFMEIDSRAFRFYDNEEELTDSLMSKMQRVEALAADKFSRYTDAGEEKRLEVMLGLLAACKNFDEQCSLWRLWSNSMNSIPENVWLLAVGQRLMDSGYYNPLINTIWFSFRSICQIEFFGASRDSDIPNDFYNEYRRKCYVACLKRIERHPDDPTAMAAAYSIAGRTNISRMGQFMFGNDAVIEMYTVMPKRYEFMNENEDNSDD